MADDNKKRLYDVEPKPTPSPTLKQKQRQSIVDEYNKPDPVGDFVRRIIGGNKEKKKSGY